MPQQQRAADRCHIRTFYSASKERALTSAMDVSFGECVLVHSFAVVHRLAIFRGDVATEIRKRHSNAKAANPLRGKVSGFEMPLNYPKRVLMEALLIAWPFWLLHYGVPISNGGPLIITAMSAAMMLDSALPRARIAPGPEGFSRGLLFYVVRAATARLVVLAKTALLTGAMWALLQLGLIARFLKPALAPMASIVGPGFLRLDNDIGDANIFVLVFFTTTMATSIRIAYSGLIWPPIYIASTLLVFFSVSRLFALQGASLIDQTNIALAYGGTLMIPAMIDYFIWGNRDDLS